MESKSEDLIYNVFANPIFVCSLNVSTSTFLQKFKFNISLG